MSTTLFTCSQPCMLRTGSDPLGKCTAHHAIDNKQRAAARRLPGHAFVLASQPHRGRTSLRCSAGLSSRHDNQPSSPKDAAERRHLLLQYIKDVQPAVMEAFIEQAPPAVVSAMRTTITNMLGTLPPQFFTVTISTLGENLSQLMYSMMMTGYMFRNAQYRLELRGSLGPAAAGAFTTSAAAVQPLQSCASSPGTSPSTSPFSSSSSSSSGDDSSDDLEQAAVETSSSTTSYTCSSSSSLVPTNILDETLYAPGVQKSRVQGDVLLWHKENGLETMNAVQYIELLEAEVSALRSQLGPGPSNTLTSRSSSSSDMYGALTGAAQRRQLSSPATGSPSSSSDGMSSSPLLPVAPQQQQQQGVMLRSDDLPNELLEYLRALEPANLNELTSAATPEVSTAMDAFVGRLMGTTDKEMLRRAGSDCTAQELGKLMFWLMVVGYTLRGMEVRLEMEGALDLLPRGGGSSGSGTWGTGGSGGMGM